MTRNEYLSLLEQGLSKLNRQHANSALDFFNEQISDRIDSGMLESDAVASLEPPQKAAENILAYYDALSVQGFGNKRHVTLAPSAKKRDGQNVTKIVLILAGILTSPIWLPLILGVLALVVGIYLFFWAIVLALGLTVLAFALAAVVSLIFAISIIPQGLGAAIAHLGLFFGFAGTAILAGVLSVLLAKGLIWITIRIFRGIKKIIASRPRSARRPNHD